MTIKVRRDNMQSYLAAQIVPPLYQVHAREMTLSTQQDANNILKQLKNGGDFAKLATKSVDTSTNTKGGDLGWLAKGQYAQTIASGTSGIVDNWIFDPARKPNELSPVITENGAYHIIQILQIDPARSVDATTLSSLQGNALTSWLLSVKAQQNLTTIASDQNKLLDTSNIPNTTPAIPASPPAAPGTPTVGTGQ
jgi:parvulin-like peptidyl-prolyl isomerase